MHKISEEKLDGHEAQATLAEAAAFAKKGRICLCLEHDWRGRHRANVAKRLEAFGCEAVHLAPEASA